MGALFAMALACSGYGDKVPEPVGSAPSFTPGTDGPPFISIDEIYAEFDRGAGFYFIDARPKVDYELERILGAYSAPFYEVEDHFDRFPVGHWYIAYCACPHSESGIVAEYFWENGHENIGILDEGFLEWVDRGYPTEGTGAGSGDDEEAGGEEG